MTLLFPEVSPEEACAEILDYFSGVGGAEQQSPWPQVPGGGDGGLTEFNTARVEDLLKNHKRVRSCMDGDHLPHLVLKFPHLFASPVATIFDLINRAIK